MLNTSRFESNNDSKRFPKVRCCSNLTPFNTADILNVVIILKCAKGSDLCMKEDILSLLLQAESEYQGAVKKAVKEAESYVDDRRKEQAAYIEKLKQDLHMFEKTDSEMLEQMLIAESESMEEEMIKLKEQMKIRQEEKADRISGFLKEEVLSLLWQ